jgi:hypothetical protein
LGNENKPSGTNMNAGIGKRNTEEDNSIKKEKKSKNETKNDFTFNSNASSSATENLIDFDLNASFDNGF